MHCQEKINLNNYLIFFTERKRK